MQEEWKCERCGECCNTPKISEKDIERIKKLGLNDFAYTGNLGDTYMKDKDGKCMFLVRGRISSCKIYDARPKICRLYPSELRNGDCKPEKLAFDEYLEKRNEKK